MLYKQTNFEKAFTNPTSEYRGTPFWSWNSDLNEQELEAQIKIFNEMGFGGFHIHSRIGLNTRYLGPRFMEMVKHCNTVGKELGMLTWLYDEDKWPSGFAGGFVTENEDYRIRYLLFSPFVHEDGPLSRNLPQASRVNMDGESTYLCSYEVELREGNLISYSRVAKDHCPKTGSRMWHAYRVVSGPTSWFNDQSYVDTLNPRATKRFIEVTHEAYARTLGDEFGKSVPAMFTDEPQYFRFQNLVKGDGLQEAGLPYTDDLDEDYQQAYGESLFDRLPEIFWGTISAVRHHYFEILTERFANAYCKTIDDWCMEHGILSTGHLMGESSLELQSRLCGEAMRSYRSFKLPGIDMLADRREYITAKQAQSACHQYGYGGVLSELYGVTNWDFDLRGHKLQGDWQAALGVTVRVHHLSWATMAGESKRDYPSPIDQHATWYREYHELEDYFSRVNVAMTTGKPVVRIGVLHPIESYWLAFGPDDQSAELRKRLESQFESLTSWLLFGQLDFDFVAESLLPSLYQGTEDEKVRVGQSAYDVLLVPGMLTMRQSSLDILSRCHKAGVKVIFLGSVPTYIDAQQSDKAQAFAAQCTNIGFEQWQLMDELASVRELEVLDETQTISSDLLYQMREQGNRRFLFVVHGRERNRMQVKNFRSEEDATRFFKVRGSYSVLLLDPKTGKNIPLSSEVKHGWTRFSHPFHAHDSLLVELVEEERLSDSVPVQVRQPELIEKLRLRECNAYTLEEPNQLLLDQAEFCLNGGQWHSCDELLLVDDKVRELCGYPKRSEAFPQPWLCPEDENTPHTVLLRFAINSEVEVQDVRLACETADAIITFNNQRLESLREGWFVDPSIVVFRLGTLQKGSNVLELEIPFGRKTNLEWCYLLGSFGVRLEGDRAVVTAMPKCLAFGDITRQGFPFYGGSVTYELAVEGHQGTWTLKVPQYKGGLLSVTLDGERIGQIIGEPYTIDLGARDASKHILQITCYGNRFNTFGQLHNCNRYEAYFGPKSWRSTAELYSYVYQVRPAGILTEPFLEVYAD